MRRKPSISTAPSRNPEKGLFISYKGHVMPKRMITLIYPQALIKEPVIYRLSREFKLIPNVRRARVTEQTGEVLLELDGEEGALNKGIAYLTDLGIRVEPTPEKGR